MSLETQRQIRENVDEAQDYLHNLQKWQTAMKDRVVPSSASFPPPPRTALADPKRDTDPSIEAAEELRKQGNAFFKTGDYDSAARLYTESLDVCRSCAGFANRAMTYLKLKENAKAEADCDAALEFDKVNLKTYQRRSLARQRQGNLQGALVDAEMALRLQPTSDVVRSSFDECLKEIVDTERLEWPRRMQCLTVEMDPPLQTIDVPTRQSGSDFDAIARVRSRSSSMKRQMTETVEKEATEKLANKVRQTEDPSLKETTSVDISKASMESEGKHSGNEQKMGIQTGLLKEGQTAVIDIKAEGKLDEDPTPTGVIHINPENSLIVEVPTKNVEAVRAQPAVSKSKKPPPLTGEASMKQAAKSEEQQMIPEGPPSAHHSEVPSKGRSSSYPIPKTWASFEAGYKSLKHCPEVFGQYLSQIDPDILPVLFKSALTAPILTAILEAVLHHLNERTASTWLLFLEALQKVPRYDLLRMSLTSKAKRSFKEQWTAMAKSLPSDIRTQLISFFN